MRAEDLRTATDAQVVEFYEADRRTAEHEAGRERALLLREFLVASVLVQDGSRSVLDVGCGDGHLAVFLARLGLDVTAMDACLESVSETIDRADRDWVDGVEGHAGLIEDLDRVAAYDAVVCCETIEHVRNPRAAVARLARAARRIVVMTTPVGHCYDDPSHLHHWDDGAALAKDLGFDEAFGGNYQIEPHRSRWGDEGLVFVVIGRPSSFVAGARAAGATFGS